MATTRRHIETGPESGIDVVFFGNCYLENDGIGHYEFWGSPGYDRGRDYAVCDAVSYDTRQFTRTQNKIIGDYLQANYDDISAEIEQEFERIHLNR